MSSALSRLFWRYTALILFAVYLGWQVFWIGQKEVPESLFLAITGLPAPTTGGTRSFKCLLAGQWQASLAHNPFTVPMLVLLMVSLTCPIFQYLTGRRINLPRKVVVAWCLVLVAAWLFKLIQMLVPGY